jgi:hypothetical protein
VVRPLRVLTPVVSGFSTRVDGDEDPELRHLSLHRAPSWGETKSPRASLVSHPFPNGTKFCPPPPAVKKTQRLEAKTECWVDQYRPCPVDMY